MHRIKTYTIKHTLQENIDQMLELRCDAKLTKHYSSERQNEYLQTILKVLKQKNLSKMQKSCLTASFVTYSAYALTRQRFELVLNNKHSSKLKTLLCYGIALLLFVGSYFIILQPNQRITSGPGPSLILHTPENKYKLYIDGKLYKTLTSKEAHSKKYSKYELIEGSN